MNPELRAGFTLPAPGTHRLLIKNMVCPQCIRVVTEDLMALGLQVHRVVLGEADVSAPDQVAGHFRAAHFGHKLGLLPAVKQPGADA